MSDPVAFLRARMDEDEAAAKAAARYWDGVSVESATSAEGAHVARHDPARVLREVEAKRAILDEHEIVTFEDDDMAEMGKGCSCCGPQFDRDDGACPTILALAAVYRDHPDYRPEWKP